MSSGDTVNIVKSAAATWRQVCSVVNKAVVFLDSRLAECLHWNGGAMLLLSAGAVNVKELSSFESCAATHKKAVFLVSGVLDDTAQHMLKDIITASQLQYVIVLSTVPPGVQPRRHGSVSDAHDRSAFDDLEDMLLEWMGNHNYTAEVRYEPLVVAPITPNLFVLPQCASLFPLLPTDLHTASQFYQGSQKRRGSEFDLSLLPNGNQLRSLVLSLNSVLEQLSVSDDVFSLGHTSRMVATELASLNLAKTRRKTSTRKASLLLVDRSLDLTSAVGHHLDTLLDRLLCVLPRLPGHTVDVAVDMTILSPLTSNPDYRLLAAGCLAHPTDIRAASLLNTLAATKHKDGVMEVNRQLVAAASKEGLPVHSQSGRVTAEQLQTHLRLFQRENAAIRQHSGLLQLAAATQHTLLRASGLDSLLAVEKGLLESVGEGGTLGLLTAAVNRDRERPDSDRLYTVSEVLCLLVYVYSMAGDKLQEDVQQERVLQVAIVNAIREANSKSLTPAIHELVVDTNDEKMVTSHIEEFFYKLRGLGSARLDLKQFSSIHTAGGLTSQASIKPLLKQLAQQIVDPNKPELVDVEYKSSGLRDLLKTGFGFFMNVSKPRPSDHPLLIVFVIGGVTTTEVRQMRETFSASNIQILVGSTTISRPEDVMYRALIQDNLHPVKE